MTFQPTVEQAAIITAATQTADNLLVSALAGAAKTSTLVMVAQALPDTRMLCLAFNKKIATEMQERLPDNCTAMTLNSLGHRIWSDTLGRRLRVKGDKNYEIITELVNKLPHDQKTLAFDRFADYVRILGSGKSAGYVPDNYRHKSARLMNNMDFFDWCDEVLDDWEEEMIETASRMSLDQSFAGTIDFDDQILMPTVFPSPFPRYPLVLVDEAQDLSALNHKFLSKLVTKRLIAVGDECQAIYGFRGAHENSMSLLERQFSMKRLVLSVTFRCPVEVVKHAQWRAPHMKWGPNAPAGEVKRLREWTMDDIPEQAAIICRNNAPLFNLAIRMLRHGRYAELMGNDIGKGLVKIMKKFGSTTTKQDAVIAAIDQWEKEKIAKVKNAGPVEDKAQCMRIFAMQGKTLGDAIAYAEHIFESSGPVKLMTGHKSKGLEFDNVFILDDSLIGEEGQERNLRYVMQTRAKSMLAYINTKEMVIE